MMKPNQSRAALHLARLERSLITYDDFFFSYFLSHNKEGNDSPMGFRKDRLSGTYNIFGEIMDLLCRTRQSVWASELTSWPRSAEV